MRNLSQLEIGQQAVVYDICTNCTMRRRLLDLGIIKGTIIRCTFKSPFGDPVAFSIKGATIALRSEDTRNIIISDLK